MVISNEGEEVMEWVVVSQLDCNNIDRVCACGNTANVLNIKPPSK